MTLPDHIGWDVARAARAWTATFNDRMAAAGYPQYAAAPGQLLQWIAPGGAPQSEVVANSGLTRQAVQQLLDSLEADGLIARQPDPGDPRRKRVVYTRAGRQMRAAAAQVKAELEQTVEDALGADRLAQLKTLLAELEAGIVK